MFSTYTFGFFGTIFIRSGWSAWYDALAKPLLAPSSSIFFTIIVTLYTLLGLALGVLWNQTDLWHPWVANFFVGLSFNAAWMIFFFGFHVILIALIDILCLVFITITLVLGAMEIDKRAGYLMMPYLLWLLFALYLTAGVWFLG